MLRFALISVFIFFSIALFGQKRYLDSLSRAQYVERFPDYFFIWPVVRQRASSFVLQSASNSNDQLTFSPNIRYHAGLGFYLFEIGFQFIVAIPPSQSSINEYGKSNSLDLQANLIGKNWLAEGFTESYKGYYIEDSNRPIPSGEPKFQRRDIETTNLGITGMYFFNKRKYSVRSSFNFYERQLRSAGSISIQTSYNRFSLKADSLIYNLSQYPSFGDAGNFNQMSYYIISLAPGYGYNYVFHKNFFLSSSVNVGPSFQFFNYEIGAKGNRVVEVRPYLNWRVGVGFNSERFFAGVNYSYQTLEVDYENIRFTSRNGTFRFVFGYRFREVGVLRKRASEMIKPKGR